MARLRFNADAAAGRDFNSMRNIEDSLREYYRHAAK